MYIKEYQWDINGIYLHILDDMDIYIYICKFFFGTIYIYMYVCMYMENPHGHVIPVTSYCKQKGGARQSA